MPSFLAEHPRLSALGGFLLISASTLDAVLSLWDRLGVPVPWQPAFSVVTTGAGLLLLIAIFANTRSVTAPLPPTTPEQPRRESNVEQARRLKLEHDLREAAKYQSGEFNHYPTYKCPYCDKGTMGIRGATEILEHVKAAHTRDLATPAPPPGPTAGSVAEVVSEQRSQPPAVPGDLRRLRAHVRQNEERPEHGPPPGALYWKGKAVHRCPFCGFGTTDMTELAAHKWKAHTEPPNEQAAKEVYESPEPWAQEAFHHIGDGSAYVQGVSTDPFKTLFTSRRRLAELMASSLFEPGEAPKRPQVPEGEFAPRKVDPTSVFTFHAADGSRIDLRPTADGIIVPQSAEEERALDGFEVPRVPEHVGPDAQRLGAELLELLQQEPPPVASLLTNHEFHGVPEDTRRRITEAEQRLKAIYLERFGPRVTRLLRELDALGVGGRSVEKDLASTGITWATIRRAAVHLSTAGARLTDD